MNQPETHSLECRVSQVGRVSEIIPFPVILGKIQGQGKKAEG